MQFSESTRLITVYIIDDDSGIRAAFTRLFKAAGFRSRCFQSMQDFTAAAIETERSCILADLHIAGEDSIELPAVLAGLNISLPVIFVSADDSESTRARVKPTGGVGLFHKPVDDQALLDAVK